MDGGASLDIGARVVQAARMAVAMHMYQAARERVDACCGVKIGGAGPRVVGQAHSTSITSVVTDDGKQSMATSAADAHAARWPRI